MNYARVASFPTINESRTQQHWGAHFVSTVLRVFGGYVGRCLLRCVCGHLPSNANAAQKPPER